MTTTDRTAEINAFTARTVEAMTAEERAAWESLSEIERKTIAASAFFFAEEVRGRAA